MARWVALYFAAFYCAHLLEQVLRPDTFVSLVAVLLSLVVSAVLMLGNDWSGLVSGAAAETTGLAGRGEGEPGRDGRSDEDCAELCAKLAREHDLTHRETDILAMLLRDVPTRAIAEQSQVSTCTAARSLSRWRKTSDAAPIETSTGAALQGDGDIIAGSSRWRRRRSCCTLAVACAVSPVAGVRQVHM